MSKIEIPRDWGDEPLEFQELPDERVKLQPLRLTREMWQRIAALMTAKDAINSVPTNETPESEE